ncbi:MAG: efflux RND transporter permease subunit, partial [Acidobacteria bacterium]|nr:efflux RND transporter permease subunit [Acidobacteriota bacterium]
MLSAIVHFSLRFRGAVLSLALAMLGYGLFTLSHAKYDVFPEFAPPVVTIQTEAPGLSPEQVELLVTQPIENVINGVTGIDSLRSNSIQGLSITTVIFRSGSDIYLNRQLVNERLATLAGQLPHGVSAPIMTPLTLSTGTVLVIGLTSQSKSLMDQRTVADWTLRPRLLAVPGVASVTVFGGEVKQIQVQPRPDRLIRYGLSLNDVVTAAQKATGVLGAGFIENSNQRLIIQSQGQSITPAQIAATVLVRQNGANATLGQVADVVEGQAPPFGAASVEGKTGVVLVISGQYGSNTSDVTARVDSALAELNPVLQRQGIAMRTDLFRPAKFIDIAVHNVRNSLLLGAAFVIVILFLFLFDLRVAA